MTTPTGEEQGLSEEGVPAACDRLLRALLPPTTYEVISGDLEEIWRTALASDGPRRARALYRRQAIASLVAAWRRPHRRRPARSGNRPARESGGAGLLSGLLQDISYGLRMLLVRPLFAITAILILALGIAAVTTLYSVIDAALVRPLPYRDPGRVAFLLGWDTRQDEMRFNLALADVDDLREQSSAFQAVAAYTGWSANLAGLDQPERVQAYRVTPETFALLGVEAGRGQVFSPGDSDANRVVLSHAFWQRRLAGDPQVLGRTLSLDGEPHTVIGVMPAGFEFPIFNYKGDLWTPWIVDRGGWAGDRDAAPKGVAVGRLRDGVGLAAAQAEVDTLMQRLAGEHPETNAAIGVRISPMQELLAEQLRPALLAAFAAVVLVLLMICATIANLLLVRGVEREREVAVRSALGAGRMRLLRQFLTESLLLAILSGAAGIGLAALAVGLVKSALPDFILRVAPGLLSMRVHGPVLLFVLAVSLLAAVTFGLVPAVSALRAQGSGSLHGGRSRRRSSPLRRILVGAEVAIALVLVVATGLMARTFGNLAAVEPGFEAERVLALSVSLPADRYGDVDSRRRYFRQVVERVVSVPGVEAAGWVNTLPFSTADSSTRFRVAGVAVAAEEVPRAGIRVVTPGYFEAIGLALVRGRPLGDEERADGDCAVLVNRTLEGRFLDGAALGRQLLFGPEESGSSCTVVGVVADVLHRDLTAQPQPEIYVSLEQAGPSQLTLAVRTEPPPETLTEPVRRAIFAVDAEQPVFDVTTLERLIANSVLPRTLALAAMAAFGIVALVLAALGLYGVVAYTLSLRAPQIAVRIALGASPAHVVRLSLVEGLLPALLGLAVGAVAAVAVSRLLSVLLFGVPPGDPLSLGLGIAALLAAALLASWLPARRASRIDPIAAIRAE